MRKFTVISGGGKGPPRRDTGRARYHFQQMIIEILRALARGHDAQHRIAMHLDEFLHILSDTNVRPELVVEESIVELNKELDHRNGQDFYEQEREVIVLRALQVAAEALASDDAAKGRLGRRQSALRSAIEHQFLRREMRRELRERENRTVGTPDNHPKRTKRTPGTPGSDDDTTP
jgi:hypothetical protein